VGLDVLDQAFDEFDVPADAILIAGVRRVTKLASAFSKLTTEDQVQLFKLVIGEI